VEHSATDRRLSLAGLSCESTSLPNASLVTEERMRLSVNAVLAEVVYDIS